MPATFPPSPAPASTALRQAGGRPMWQPVTNRNSINGAQGTASTTNPCTMTRLTKTVQVDCSELRTVVMGFQVASTTEKLLMGDMAGASGAFSCTGATVAAGGSGYTIGDLLSFGTTSFDLSAVVLRVVAVSSGAITAVEVADGGCIKTQLASGAGPASAAKRGGGASAGTGATFNFSWHENALGVQLGIEPTAANAAGSNATAIIRAGIGLRYDGQAVQNTMLVQDGAHIVTDPIRLPLTKGSPYAERLQTMGAPAATQRTTMASDYFANASTPSGSVYSGTLAAGTGVATVGTITLGRPNAPAPWYCVVGDSIDYGLIGTSLYDAGDAALNSGWVERGLQLAGGFGLLSVARPGDSLGKWYQTNNLRFMRLTMLSKLSEIVNFGTCVFIVSLGVNDVTASTTTANIQAMIQWLCQDLLAFNPAGLYYSTIMPGGVTSTDSFATVGNQTVNATFDANRKAVNTWLKSGAGGSVPTTGWFNRTRVGVIDRAAAVEANNGGLGVWQPGMSADGTHPTQPTHTSTLAPLMQSVAASFVLPS